MQTVITLSIHMRSGRGRTFVPFAAERLYGNETSCSTELCTLDKTGIRPLDVRNVFHIRILSRLKTSSQHMADAPEVVKSW